MTHHRKRRALHVLTDEHLRAARDTLNSFELAWADYIVYRNYHNPFPKESGAFINYRKTWLRARAILGNDVPPPMPKPKKAP